MNVIEDDILKECSERILCDVKNYVKQVYHEAVNKELSPVNRTYICGCLIKALDETLRHGLKSRHLGYWKIIRKIIHPDLYEKLSAVAGFSTAETAYIANGRAWICLALLDDAFISYIHCFINEKRLSKYYEKGSIVLASDLVNRFVSFLSGLENISFAFELKDVHSLPNGVQLYPTFQFERILSLTDSGVASSLDLLNGNLPFNDDLIVKRRDKKDGSTKRHVSFHEDSIEKTSGKGRKLVWDSEKARYSWGGEDLESFKLPTMQWFQQDLGLSERGTPEGQETPHNDTVVLTSPKDIVKPRIKPPRVISSTPLKKLIRSKQVNHEILKKFQNDLNEEIASFRPVLCPYQIQLPTKLITMLKLSQPFKSYKLWSRVLILCSNSLSILEKNLTHRWVKYSNITQILVHSHFHSFDLQTKKETFTLVTGSQALTELIIGQIEWHMRKLQIELANVLVMEMEDIEEIKRLVGDEKLLYTGIIRLQYENSLVNNNTDEMGKRGFLMYNFEPGDSWYPGDFLLRGGILYLINENKQPQIAINIKSQCTSCDRIFNAHHPHMFALAINNTENIKENGFYADLASKSEDYPNKAKRKSMFGRFTNHNYLGQFVSNFLNLNNEKGKLMLYFAAADEYELSEWTQSFLQVFCQDSTVNITTPETTESLLLLTNNRAMVLSQSPPPKPGFQVTSSTLIDELTSFTIGPTSFDAYCILELESMEASNTTSDWIFHFGSQQELLKYKIKFRELYKGVFPLEISSDERCIRYQSLLAKEWFA